MSSPRRPADTRQVHVGETTRGMSILPTDSHATFLTALSSKFPQLAARSSTGKVSVRFRDEDGDMVSLVDEGDFEAAVDVARWASTRIQ